MTNFARILALPVKAYRAVLSPLLRPSCRYYPTCSDYALQALARHGALKGLWLALRRFCRCHPWGGSGLDPVPGTPDWDRVNSAGFSSPELTDHKTCSHHHAR
ncbi:MAG: membrane protein insertion efficiency factor YidD [Proteobacteria bacterium]|nr:membrane protein insertion efficiency factor YidD [Pseudomonadota bacterium]